MRNSELNTQKLTINKSDAPFTSTLTSTISSVTESPNLDSSRNSNHQENNSQQASTITPNPSMSSNPYQSPTASLTDSWQQESQSANTNNSKWYQLSGRIGRLRYLGYQLLMTVLMYLAFSIVAVGFGSLMGLTTDFYDFILLIYLPLLPFIFYNVIIYPKRRLHDLNLSGWLAILMFVPLVNALFSLYLIFARGNESVNQYGYPPRPNRNIHYVGVVVAIVGIIMLGILAAIAIPAYDSYTKRAQQLEREQVERVEKRMLE